MQRLELRRRVEEVASRRQEVSREDCERTQERRLVLRRGPEQPLKATDHRHVVLDLFIAKSFTCRPNEVLRDPRHLYIFAKERMDFCNIVSFHLTRRRRERRQRGEEDGYRGGGHGCSSVPQLPHVKRLLEIDKNRRRQKEG